MPVASKWILGIVLSVAAINFVTMPAEEYIGDGVAVRIETIGLIETGKWAVPAEVARDWGERGQYFYQNSNGAFYPKYGILNTLIYLPPLWIQKITRGNRSLYLKNAFSLNLFNVVLSCATAAYLALLARRYSASNLTMAIFVAASFYCTFWWNYLRAQTFEIYLTLFFIAFYYHFVAGLNSGQRDRRNRQFLVAAIYLGLLCLSKTLFVIFVPIAIAFAAFDWGRRNQTIHDAIAFWWLPLTTFIGVLLATNWYKFGSPFSSGYTQWSEESHPFTTNIGPGVVGLLFSKQGSVFLYFPVFIFALIGWPMFFKRNQRDAQLLIGFGAILFLVTSAFTNWKGSACYGPRYLLPVLPVVSIAFVYFVDWLRGLGSTLRWVVRAVLIGSLAYSFILQVAVNSLPFFFWYDLLNIAEQNEPASNYLDAHFGAVSLDFIGNEFGLSARFQNKFVSKLDSEEFTRLEGLKMEVQPNYYWLGERQYWRDGLRRLLSRTIFVDDTELVAPNCESFPHERSATTVCRSRLSRRAWHSGWRSCFNSR